MSQDFSDALHAILHGRDRPRPAARAEKKVEPADGPENTADRRSGWFARFAPEQVMPLLERTAAAVRRRGYPAMAWLGAVDGRLIAQLEVTPPGLPAGARSPRLQVTASRPPRLAHSPESHDRPLLVEYTGTFLGAGATGGFGAEVDYNTIYPDQLEEQLLDFVKLATGT